MEMAPEMTRYARRAMKNGVVPPVKWLDAADRRFISVSEGCGPSAWLLRQKSSKMNHISFAFSPSIQTDDLTPFPSN